MDAPTFIMIIIGAVGAVAAMATVLISIYVYRKANPKKLIEYKVRITALLSKTRVTTRKLRLVNEDGETLIDPHWVELSLWSAGRADIRAGDFDGERPIGFTLGKETRVLEIQSGIEQFGAEIGEREPRIFFHPYTMPCKYGPFTIMVLCEGKPDVNLISPHPFADIPVRDVSTVSTGIKRPERRLLLATVLSTVLTVVTMSFVLTFLPPFLL